MLLERQRAMSDDSGQHYAMRIVAEGSSASDHTPLESRLRHNHSLWLTVLSSQQVGCAAGLPHVRTSTFPAMSAVVFFFI
mmetsp:Transcript_41254/g.119287  ORF Transcript_41254/g.119287 Transcript_41254/m.119287 type:complete len:80 (+) Transcript_41254:1269-1508(+)